MNELIMNFENNTQVQEASNTQVIITYVVLGFILLVMIGYIIFKIAKHYYKKRKEIKKRIKRNEVNKEIYREYVISICEIIDYTNKEMDNFQVSIGSRKMSEVKHGAIKLLTILYNREDFNDFKESEKYKPFVENIQKLIETSPNTWRRACAYEIDYFNELKNALVKDELYEMYEKRVKESIEEKYYED
ncbi:MHJ_0274 family protein [[Mycoplasma] gypis]|uniref:DUF4760 domain-containing protein n=1 Tax=[Mycoplasma] gypis TaxID=92404 RepID=A0ABZ2RSJ2_9BACT|nr:hypothetical protein [[Mycoplasma] gypis]MBN0919209.1 hypothetical protein [[Mycoplasma] gypis]